MAGRLVVRGRQKPPLGPPAAGAHGHTQPHTPPTRGRVDPAVVEAGGDGERLAGGGRVRVRSGAGEERAEAAQALMLAELQARLGKTLVIVGPSTRALRVLAEDLLCFAQPLRGQEMTLILPPLDVSPYLGLSPNRQRLAERLSTFYRLIMGDRPRFLLLPMKGLMRRLPPASVFADERVSRVVGVGDMVDLDELRGLLLQAGYGEVQVVEDPGTFAIRGGIVDVFAPGVDEPVRIELWGEEVERVRSFDPRTQKSTTEAEAFYLHPVREEVLSPATLANARTRLREQADEQGVPTSTLQRVLSDLDYGIHFLGIEALLPAFYNEPLCDVRSVLPNDAVIVVLDPQQCAAAAQTAWDLMQTQHQQHAAENRLCFGPEHFVCNPADVTAWLAQARLSWTAGGDLDTNKDTTETEPNTETITLPVISNDDISHIRTSQGAGDGTVRALVSRLHTWRKVYSEIAFVCRTSGSAERLAGILRACGQKTEIVGRKPLYLAIPPTTSSAASPTFTPPDALNVYEADISSGVRIPAKRLAIITADDIFGPHTSRRRATTQTPRSFLESFKELKPNDHVVHAQHGVGRYEGLVKIDVGGLQGDFLLLRYAGDDKLYVPVHKLGGVQKFSGDQPRKLDKLGGTQWEKTKASVKTDLKALAHDLLRLYAERQSRPGFTFSPPDAMFAEFEAAFPFEETPDQARAIAAALSDMQRPRPMDRLVCGDVGFGKTEVAMRAAFKAVLDSKQVAVLVPTTLLAEQHLHSFQQRFAGYPVRIAGLSRFRTPKETKNILKAVADGQLDIVIGTHRLLSKDVQFKSLGLLVVDEEHRFGVSHKEKIKQISATVDSLTMTATPIPRTLQMSMMGMRDMSIIATPPRDRLSIRTSTARFTPSLVREAVRREVLRGGQVYILHNRVQDLMEYAAKIQRLLPELRVAVAHGQMDERELEQAMLEFVRGDAHILVCTSIIESGIDIPNANTILIDRADTFGLAQLYQIRGRVGRSSQRAHCYLLLPEKGEITSDARARLEALERFTELGSGFEIANWDLELRGAGNVLGDEQSGHIEAIGLDLYADLLEEVMAEIKGEQRLSEIEPDINIPVEARLPDGYIPDVQLRLLFYKRLSSARDDEELFDIYGELQDRFGEPPGVVKNLRRLIEIKVLVRSLRLLGVDVSTSAVVLNLGNQNLLDPMRIVAMVSADRKRYTLRPDMRLVRYLTPAEGRDLLATTQEVLRTLIQEAKLRTPPPPRV